MADVNAISSAIGGSQVAQTQQVAPPKPAPEAATPQQKVDVVTISAQGKTAVQQTAQYSPTEEQKESSTKKATETQSGKK
jgi:hypothetical protein